MSAGKLTAGHVFMVCGGMPPPELRQLADKGAWRVTQVDSTAGVLRRLRRETDIDVVLLCPEPPCRPYTELCRDVKFDARTAFLSIIFALLPDSELSRADVYACGADDCIELPAPPAEIALRLSNASRLKRATDSLEDATFVVSSLANAIEGRDVYTRGHVERVSAYCLELGRRVGLGVESFATLRTGGVVHDIGKVAVPDQILNKPGPLTDEEFDIIKRHPVVGYDILKPLRTFQDVLPIVRWHHERPNGLGYPDGLCGDELPLLPRIVAVADVFDAISTARAYRPAFPPERCRSMLTVAAERGDLDAGLVALLLEILDEDDGRQFLPATHGAGALVDG